MNHLFFHRIRFGGLLVAAWLLEQGFTIAQAPGHPERDAGVGQGAAYVFMKSGSWADMTQTAELTPPTAPGAITWAGR